MWSCYSPRRHCPSPNPVDNSKSTTFSVSGSCLLCLPSLHPEHEGLPDAPTFLPISHQSPELHALKNSRVIWFGSPVQKQETQRHVVNLPNAQQLVQRRARSQALSSAQGPLHLLSILLFAFSFNGFGLLGPSEVVAKVLSAACSPLARGSLFQGELDRFDLTLQPVKGQNSARDFCKFPGRGCQGPLAVGPALSTESLFHLLWA